MLTIPYSIVWTYASARAEQGDRACLVDLYSQLGVIVPSLDLDSMAELMETCPAVLSGKACGVPDVPAMEFWKVYTSRADLSGYTLKAIAKIAKVVSPAAAWLLVQTWLDQKGGAGYSPAEIAGALRFLPEYVRETLVPAKLNPPTLPKVGAVIRTHGGAAVGIVTLVMTDQVKVKRQNGSTLYIKVTDLANYIVEKR